MRKLTINVLMPVYMAFALYVGCTGKVSWWTLALIFLMQIKLEYTRKV